MSQKQKPVEPRSNDLIPARGVKKMCGDICDMTLWRWMNDEDYQDLDFPKPVKIANRNYWNRGKVETFIENLTEKSNYNFNQPAQLRKHQEQQCAVNSVN